MPAGTGEETGENWNNAEIWKNKILNERYEKKNCFNGPPDGRPGHAGPAARQFPDGLSSRRREALRHADPARPLCDGTGDGCRRNQSDVFALRPFHLWRCDASDERTEVGDIPRTARRVFHAQP